MGSLSIETILAYALGILLLYIIAKSFQLPIKILGKIVINCILGGMILIIINYFGHFINFYLPLNFFTALITGFLGIPGIILVFMLTILF